MLVKLVLVRPILATELAAEAATDSIVAHDHERLAVEIKLTVIVS
jgi:hypothetical protein